MRAIKLSILITCYNCEKYIDDAVNSVVVMNKPFEWELLVGDDGSDDGTIEKVQKWINKYPYNMSLFVMDRNGTVEKNGTRAAKNRANLLEHAKGEYITFLDGDDQYLGTEKLVRQIAILDSPKNSMCACVAHNIMAYDVVNNKKGCMTKELLPEGIVDSNKYWRNLYFHTNTIVFRNECVKLMLKDEYKNYLNDNFITFCILQYGKIYYLPESWAQYNLTGDGLWTGKKRTYGCFRNMILFDLEQRISESMRKDSWIRHLYDFRYLFKHYCIDDRDRVNDLISSLSPDDFHYTFLMYKMNDELTLNEKKEKSILYKKIRIYSIFIRVYSRLMRLKNKTK